MFAIFDQGKRGEYLFWLLLIMLTAVSLRFYQLNYIPPGLTHDEADHGITAVSILNGTREIYFIVGHGREPLFDYATAGFMMILGQSGWVLRGTAVFFSLVMIAGMAAWVRLAFNGRVALFTAAGLAVSFWPLMAARQGLRSITLPALFVLTLTFFWRGLQTSKDRRASSSPLFTDFRLLLTFLLAGLFLGFTFYTYIPARGLWLLFPTLLLIGGLMSRRWLQKSWPGTLLMLLVAGAVAWPLFAYLQANPAAEVRIDELSVPLTAAWQGDFSLLWQNVKSGLAIFTVTGDTAWRYNIAGRPLLSPLWGILFYGGLLLAVWRIAQLSEPINKRLAYATVLLWLLGGVAPVLITGAELSTTQGMGMQPVLYLFPALVLEQLWQIFTDREPVGGRWWLVAGLIALFSGTAVFTAQDYFGEWANAPEVRVQYESTMTAVMEYLDAQPQTDVAVSTITPGSFHTPALAQMTLQNAAIQPRWFDGRSSLLIPNADDGLLAFSGFAPLTTDLEPYLVTASLQDTLPLRPTDADRPIWIYEIAAETAVADWQTWLTPQAAQFGTAATLVGYDLPIGRIAAGEAVQVTTVWQLNAAQPGLHLFTHLAGSDGVPIAQADQLDAPSDSWVDGDWLVQLHNFVVPAGTAVGRYPLTIGLYTCLDVACEQTERLTVWQNGTAVGDHLQLTELEITN